MPNHIQNRLTVIGTSEIAKRVLSELSGTIDDEKTTFDFSKVIPQPSNIFNVNLGTKEREDCIREGRPNWYDWNSDNWGTKWNAYAVNDERDTDKSIYFQTAWAAPFPVIEALAKKYKEVEFLWDYADEDSGSNAGRVILKDGNAFVKRLRSQSVDAYELFFELHPDRKDDYELIDGKYKCKED